LFKNQSRVDELVGEGFVMFNQTPFYAESGGQIADSGCIESNGSIIDVLDVIKAPNKQHLHKIQTESPLKVGQSVTLTVDVVKRNNIRANHTLAHLLQAALKSTLGDHVHQAGSYVGDQYMRFDFTHFKKVELNQLKEIENWMNQQIFDHLDVSTQYMELEKAKESGAVALFNEKYESLVRVVQVGDVSMELCGGTHVTNTSDIGIAKVISEESIGSGIRRIVCKSKHGAYEEFQHAISQLETIAETLHVPTVANIEEKVQQLHEIHLQQQKEVTLLQAKITQQQALALTIGATDINGTSVVFKRIDNQPFKSLKSMVETGLRNLDRGLIFLCATDGNQVMFVSGCTKNLIGQQVDCSALVKEAAMITGGNGGGRKDLAQAGGKDLSKIDEAMDVVYKKIVEVL
jgi:alanyl-tRNA synthetase